MGTSRSVHSSPASVVGSAGALPPHLSRETESGTLDAVGIRVCADISPGPLVVLIYLHVSHNSNSGLFL